MSRESGAHHQEPIPDDDEVSRLIDEPRMFTAADGLVWHQVFQFPNGLHESVIWRKYKAANDEVHDLGYERERQKRLSGKNLGYAGFICAFAGEIRSIRTQRGHSFRLDHMPEEGIYHAGIQYAPANDGPLSSLLKNDKSELKLMLRNAFGVLVHSSDPSRY